MTVIEKLNPKVQYNGPIAINDALSINFPYTNTEDVKCVANNEQLVYNRDYTVLEQTLTIKISIPQGQTITIYRSTPLDQQAEFPQNNRFNSAKLNASLDKICMQQQEQNEKITRSVKVPIDTNISFEGSLPTPISNRILRINGEASGFEFVPYDLDERLDTFEDTVVDNITTGQEAIENSFEEFKNETNVTINNINTKVTNAINTANAADTKADEAINTANTANTKSNEAIGIVNTALTAATNAVNTADAADTKADEAIDTADAANTKADEAIDTANAAINTANTASTAATNAVNTANAANTKVGEATAIANTASTAATNAVNTANSAVTSANTAVTTANSADTKADEALSTAQEAKEASLAAEENATSAKEKVDIFEQDIEAVLSAADQIAQLESAVNTALQASEVATQAAEDAIEAVENTEAAIEAATQAAENATQSAEEATQAVANVEASLLEKADKTELNTHTGNKSNPHSVTKSQVGLGNVDNTSDINKPISNATQTALNNKLDVNGTAVKATADGSGNNIVNTYLTKSSASSTYAAKSNSLAGYGITNAYTKTEMDELLKDVGGLYIGQIIQSLLPITDAGLHLLDGTVISGNGIYSAFVNYIKGLDLTASYFTTEADWQTSVEQYGVCGKFVYNASANTVRLPKVTGFVEGTIDPAALGDLVEAGLPNITTTFTYGNDGTSQSANGALTSLSELTTSSTNTRGSGTYGFRSYRATFNASGSSSIYGNSTTVQPQTIKGYYYIVVATSTKTDIEVDIDNVVTDLNNKVDVSNMVDAGSYIANCAMPSDTYVDLTLGANGTTYTAPADGYVYLMMKLSSVGSRFYINSAPPGSDSIYGTLITQAAQANLAQILPVKKGASFTVGYDAYISDSTGPKFRFIYAVGSESEAQ